MQIESLMDINRSKFRTMFKRIPILILLAILGACANHEGLYAPDCIAYEGDRVMLQGERFEWQKFTDQQQVGSDGKIIDPFPGYPKGGAFSLVDDRVEFRPDDGSVIDDYFIVQREDSHYLLTQNQHQELLVRGVMSQCPLRQTREEN